MAQLRKFLDRSLELFFEGVCFCAESLNARVVCLVSGDCDTLAITAVKRHRIRWRTLVESFAQLLVSGHEVDCALRGWVVAAMESTSVVNAFSTRPNCSLSTLSMVE